MGSHYASVRKRWRSIETEKDLKAIWRGERFEEPGSVEEALHVYELAIRVDGWEAVKGWAREAFEKRIILNAQVVELAIRSIEQKDADFFGEITSYLIDNSPPSYFKFWFTLFSTRHSAFGETLFRRQLAKLSDHHAIKYRRWLRKIFRKLRFRCKTPREKAIGAIAFAMYKDYKKSEYSSSVCDAYIECHNVVRTRKKRKDLGKPEPKAKQMERFATASAVLGMWSITEGIRTGAKLPRTLGYLAAMAPKMTDRELLRALRAFDANLLTADHKKASENVVTLADALRERLSGMDVSLEEWSKILPYMASPTLTRVFEDILETKLEAYLSRVEQSVHFCPVVVVPETLDGRTFRIAMLLAYLLYRTNARACLSFVETECKVLCHTSRLWPYGYGVQPPAQRWRALPDRPHRVFYQLVGDTFPAAASRRSSKATPIDLYLLSLRAHLYRRVVLDGQVSVDDVPVLFFAQEPSVEDHKALSAHLSMFPGSALVLFGREWKNPVAAPNTLHLSVPLLLPDALALVEGLRDLHPIWAQVFAGQLDAANAELQHLLLGQPPRVTHIRQGPYS